MEITEPLPSPYSAGDRVAVHQLGGPLGSTQAHVPGLTYLDVGEEYLLFIYQDSTPEQYNMVGLDAGILEVTDEGDFVNPHGLRIDGLDLGMFANRDLFADP